MCRFRVFSSVSIAVTIACSVPKQLLNFSSENVLLFHAIQTHSFAWAIHLCLKKQLLLEGLCKPFVNIRILVKLHLTIKRLLTATSLQRPLLFGPGAQCIHSPRGVPPEKFGRSVRPASQNPYPIYDQNL